MQPVESKTKKTFYELGYSHMDTAEIVTLLNRLLANYSVLTQKVRGFHWNVDGADFFEMHEKFEEVYTFLFKTSDEIAERIRLFDQRPVSSYAEILKLANVKETSGKLTSYEMAKIVLEDIRLILQLKEELTGAAEKINDGGTEYFIKRSTYNIEKYHWMFKSWVKQNV